MIRIKSFLNNSRKNEIILRLKKLLQWVILLTLTYICLSTTSIETSMLAYTLLLDHPPLKVLKSKAYKKKQRNKSKVFDLDLLFQIALVTISLQLMFAVVPKYQIGLWFKLFSKVSGLMYTAYKKMRCDFSKQVITNKKQPCKKMHSRKS